MPPHIIINETMIMSQRPEQPEKRYRILPPSESIEVLQSRTDFPEESPSGNNKKYRLTRSAPSEHRLEPVNQQERALEQYIPQSKGVANRAATRSATISEHQRSTTPPRDLIGSPLQSMSIKNETSLSPQKQAMIDDDIQPSLLDNQLEAPRQPKKRYHILTLKEKIAIALKNAEAQNTSMQDRRAGNDGYLPGEQEDPKDDLPIFKSVLASKPTRQVDSQNGKKYRIVRKSDYLRIFKEQSMKSHAIDDSILDGPAYHNDLDTIGAAANPQYQHYLQFQQKMLERQAKEQAKDKDSQTSYVPNNQDTFSLEADSSKKSKHILEALKAQTHILNQLKRIKTDSMVSGIADVSMDSGVPAPQINPSDLMTNEAVHNELLKRLQADLITTRATQRAKAPSQSSHLADNSLRESDIAAGQGDATNRRSTSQSNVHKLKEKPLVDYTPPGSVNASLIQHSPRQTMSISTEINLPVLSKSFINRLLTEATKRREFAEESVHAIPELGVLFRKACTNTPKLVTSLSQDILSEFLTVVATEIINAFEEVVMEEAGGLETLARTFPASYFSKQDILNEIHNSKF